MSISIKLINNRFSFIGMKLIKKSFSVIRVKELLFLFYFFPSVFNSGNDDNGFIHIYFLMNIMLIEPKVFDVRENYVIKNKK